MGSRRLILSFSYGFADNLKIALGAADAPPVAWFPQLTVERDLRARFLRGARQCRF
jgi:hypothetical protein